MATDEELARRYLEIQDKPRGKALKEAYDRYISARQAGMPEAEKADPYKDPDYTKWGGDGVRQEPTNPWSLANPNIGKPEGIAMSIQHPQPPLRSGGGGGSAVPVAPALVDKVVERVKKDIRRAPPKDVPKEPVIEDRASPGPLPVIEEEKKEEEAPSSWWNPNLDDFDAQGILEAIAFAAPLLLMRGKGAKASEALVPLQKGVLQEVLPAAMRAAKAAEKTAGTALEPGMPYVRDIPPGPAAPPVVRPQITAQGAKARTVEGVVEPGPTALEPGMPYVNVLDDADDAVLRQLLTR